MYVCMYVYVYLNVECMHVQQVSSKGVPLSLELRGKKQSERFAGVSVLGGEGNTRGYRDTRKIVKPNLRTWVRLVTLAEARRVYRSID